MTDETERGEFASALAQAGFTDVLVVSRDVGERLLDERRRELIDHLQGATPDSGREIADALGRDPEEVGTDLDLLFGHSIIDFDRDAGERKNPRLKVEHVVIEPLV